MSLCKITIKNVKAERSNFKHFFLKRLAALYILSFLKNKLCCIVVTCSVTRMHNFLQFVEAMGMFLCKKYNRYQ